MRISKELFDHVVGILGSKESAEDVYEAFDDFMIEYEADYLEMHVTDTNYLFFIYAVGFITGHRDMPLLSFEDDDEGPFTH